MALHESQTYAYQANVMLQNEFPRIACAAINASLHSSESSFTDAYHILSKIESQRNTIDGNGTGQFEEIPPFIKVFTNIERTTNIFQLDDQQLCGEISAIPDRRLISSTQSLTLLKRRSRLQIAWHCQW